MSFIVIMGTALLLGIIGGITTLFYDHWREEKQSKKVGRSIRCEKYRLRGSWRLANDQIMNAEELEDHIFSEKEIKL